jgi:hypothetical protein
MGVVAEVVVPTAEPVVVIVPEPQPFFNLTNIVVAIIGVCAMVVTRYLVPMFKANASESTQNFVSVVVSMLVYAAEQLYKGEGRGAEKMMWVKGELQKRGLDIDIAEIEAAVMALNMEQWAIFADTGTLLTSEEEESPEPIKL